MKHYIGLDVSMKQTSICVMQPDGEICREIDLPTDAKTISAYIQGMDIEVERVGLETGSMSRALQIGLEESGYAVICLDARKASVFLKHNSHKNDRNDARMIAELVRMKALKSVHLKSDRSVEIKTVLTVRFTHMKSKGQAKNTIRGLLKHHGLKLGKGSFSEAATEAIKDLSASSKKAFESLLKSMEELDAQVAVLDAEVKSLEEKHKKIISIFQSADGIGPITSLAFLAEIDDPTRFSNGRSVGAYIGCVPRLYESGERSVMGRISKTGPDYLRSLLHEGSITLLTRTKRWSHLKAWGVRIAKRSGTQKAAVAVSRKLSIILWRMWLDERPFHCNLEKAKKKEAEKVAA